MEEPRGAKLNEIIKQLGLNESVNNDTSNGNSKANKLANVHRISARGKGLKFVPVKRPVTFTLRAAGFVQDDICITVTGPSGREVPTRIDTIRNGAYEVEYITPEIGDHIIEVLACGKAIPGSPFHSSGYDASRIRVKSVPNGIVGQPVELEIDGSEAGSGNLEILVNGGHVTSEVKCLGDHRFLASFVPHTATTHIVEMKFNDDPVPGSPWMCDISPVKSVSTSNNCNGATVNGEKLFNLQSLENFSVSQTQFFDVTCTGKTVDDLIVSIIGPGKLPIQHRVVNVSSDTFRIYFSASVVGTYLFEVHLKDNLPSKQFFNAKAYDTSRIQVSDVPKSCCLNENCTFQVDASRAGEGQLEIAVNDGDVPNQVQVQGNGKCQVTFKPESTLPHVVDIKFNGQNVPGCPFTVEVSDASQFSVDLSQLELIAVGRICKFKIDSKTLVQRDTIRVIINSPTGKLLPVTLNYGETGVSCEFHPIEVGPHIMTIEHRGRSISPGPFFIKTYDSSKVLVTPTKFGCVGKAVQFIVDAGNSGEGNLEIAVNAKGINVMTQVHPMGGAKFGVSFTPSEVCDHTVFVTFNNEPVPGSPFTVSVGADMDTISVSGTAINFAPVETTAIITIHNVTNERDLHVKIETPDGHTLPSTLKQEVNSSNCTVEFLPRIPGEHLIHLHYQGKHLPGSPFATKVYNIKEIVVKEMPSEIIVGKPVTFLVEAANAGPGNLEVIVNNGKVPSSPQALGPSQYAISFVPKDAETHFIEIRFNGEPISGSPFICNVIDASKMVIKKEGLDRIPVQSVASFTIDTKGASFPESSVSIISPSNRAIKPIILGDRSSGYKVSFTPVEVGDHLVDVRIGDISLPPCPFLVKVYDAKNVKITDIGPSTLGKPVYFSIDASSAGAGNLEIIVSVNGKNVPNYVQSEGNAKFRVNFKPSEPVAHMVSVKFNGEPVPGSPYVVNIIDSTTLNGTGQGSLKMAPVGKKVEFVVEGKNSESDVKVVITNPIGRKVRPNISRHENLFTISFTPTEVGPHQILIVVDGNTLPGSPINCNVYDVSRVRVTGLTGGYVGKPVTFQVDASEAGEGTLELVVTTKKTSVRAEVLMRSRGLYDVTFVPQERVPHYLNIQFNEEDVIGSPFKIEVKDFSSSPSTSSSSSAAKNEINDAVNGSGSHHHHHHHHHEQQQQQQQQQSQQYASGLVGSANVSSFDWPVTNDSPPEVKVTGPNGSLVASTVKLEGGTLSVEYTPKMVGLYKIEAFKDNKLVTKKPFLVEVVDPSKVKLVGVTEGVIGREQTFKVDCTKAGKGEMTINIKTGDKQVAHLIKEITSGVYNVTFVPLVDRPHYLDVRFNRYHIPGCPQLVEIRDPKQAIIVHGQGLKSCSPNVPTAFLIETGGFAAAKDFDVIITDPKGSPLPVRCYQQQDGSLLAEFVPAHVGAHKIEVSYLDAHVSGSPFVSECFDASKVIMDKIKSTNYSINEKIVFSLTRKDAGYAELDVTVTSPLGRHLPIEVIGTSDGEGELIEFIPTVVGKYKIAITFGGIEVPGSPVTFLVADANFPRVEGLGLKQGFVNEISNFTIDARGLFGTPEVKVEGVDTAPKVTLHEEQPGLYKASFVPTEVGVFDVHVTWNGKPVHSSPFHPQIVNLRKIRPIGGWENLFNESGKIIMSTMEEKRISFDTAEAGPGKLRVTIKSPDGESREGNIEQTSATKFRLSMLFKKYGEYLVSLYFADHLLPSSPLICNVSEATSNSDGATVVLRGHGLAGARVGEETEFIIDGTDAGAGEPEVSLTGVKADIAIKVTKIAAKIFKATYTASVPGTYLLNALWAGKQVKGCPLKVSILPRCDASRVHVSGEGLKGGAIGRDLKVFIDTTRAGPGELTAHCVGPQRVAHCELIDQLDGTFYLFLKPQEGGRHILTIKYGGEHVPGSPFNVRVAGAPDPSRVRVYGPGIEHGVLPLYQSRFICDTRGAGAGQLTVRIRGPKGAFRVEMQRESQKDRTILCKYDPTEPGDYRIEVKWSGEHVPGSPFCVMIFDTQDELSRFLGSHTRNSLMRPNGVPGLIGPGEGSELMSLGPISWRESVGEGVFHSRKD